MKNNLHSPALSRISPEEEGQLSAASGPVALITGASSGLGRAFAKALDALPEAQAPASFWLIARRRERLQELAGELRHPARCLALDLTDSASMASLAALLRGETAAPEEEKTSSPRIRYLVLSAGLGYMGLFAKQDWAQQERTLQINNLALTHLLTLCKPCLERGSQVFPIASVAAFLPQPGFASYAASKAFVLSLSRALHAEWKKEGITVTCVCPNPMQTEFFQNSPQPQGGAMIKKLGFETPSAVVRCALHRAARGKDLAIHSLIARGIYVAAHLLSTALILHLEKILGFYN